MSIEAQINRVQGKPPVGHTRSVSSDIQDIKQALGKIQSEMVTQTQFLELKTEVHDTKQRVTALESKATGRTGRASQTEGVSKRGLSQHRSNSGSAGPNVCYRCGSKGHFIWDCPQPPWLTGQMHVAMQPSPYSGSLGMAGLLYTVGPQGQMSTVLQNTDSVGNNDSSKVSK